MEGGAKGRGSKACGGNWREIPFIFVGVKKLKDASEPTAGAHARLCQPDPRPLTPPIYYAILLEQVRGDSNDFDAKAEKKT